MTVQEANRMVVPTEQSFPPRMIYNENGEIVGAILAYADYRTFLRNLTRNADWEQLPGHLQDAIDNMLADEAEKERGETRLLRELLAQSGELT